MNGSHDIEHLMREANPVPEPARLVELPLNLSSSSTRRRTMETHPWYRRPLVAVASFALVAAAVAAVPLLVIGNSSTPAVTEPGTTPQTTLPPSTAPTTLPEATTSTPATTHVAAIMESGETIVYGSESGLPEGCRPRVAAGGNATWAAGQCGLFRFDGTDWTQVDPLDPADTVISLVVDGHQTVWIGTEQGPVLSFDGTLTEFDTQLPRLVVDGEGTVWGLGDGLQRFDGTAWVKEDGPGDIAALAVGPDGILWAIGPWESGRPSGLGTPYSYENGAWTAHPHPSIGIVGGPAFGQNGWFSIVLPPYPCDNDRQCEGLMQFTGNAWSDPVPLPTLTELGIAALGEDNFSGLNTADLTVARDGSVWIVDQVLGAYFYDGTAWYLAPIESTTGFVSVTEGSDGSMWFGATDGKLVRYMP